MTDRPTSPSDGRSCLPIHSTVPVTSKHAREARTRVHTAERARHDARIQRLHIASEFERSGHLSRRHGPRSVYDGAEPQTDRPSLRPKRPRVSRSQEAKRQVRWARCVWPHGANDPAAAPRRRAMSLPHRRVLGAWVPAQRGHGKAAWQRCRDATRCPRPQPLLPTSTMKR